MFGYAVGIGPASTRLASLSEHAALVLVVALPVQRARGAPAIAAWVLWVLMLVFEVALVAWLLARGVNPSSSALTSAFGGVADDKL
jgi:hypothetical protein